jgi:hypothetical protein
VKEVQMDPGDLDRVTNPVPYNERPYFRVVVNEVQYPLLLSGIRAEEFRLRELVRLITGEQIDPRELGIFAAREDALITLKSQMKWLHKLRESVVNGAREKGWVG